MEKKIVITNISKDNENKKQYSGNYQYQYFYNNGNVDLSCLDLEEDYNLNSQLAAVEYNDGKCFGIHICDSESIVGNIYIGRVENVVKSLNCAFIEIKKGVTCFYSLDENKNHIFLNRKNNSNVNIGDLLLIQISREPIKTKPATATCKISFTGQFLVLSSDVKGVTISGKTKNNANCKELKQELSNYISDNDNFGFILRTNSSQAEKEEVIAEIEDKRKAKYSFSYLKQLGIIKKYKGKFYYSEENENETSANKNMTKSQKISLIIFIILVIIAIGMSVSDKMITNEKYQDSNVSFEIQKSWAKTTSNYSTEWNFYKYINNKPNTNLNSVDSNNEVSEDDYSSYPAGINIYYDTVAEDSGINNIEDIKTE